MRVDRVSYLQIGDAQASVADWHKLTLNIAFYRDGAYIAAFACGPITFMLPPHQLEGSGNIF